MSSTDRRELRNFGLIVGGIFTAIGLWPVVVRGDDPRVWAVALGVVLVLPALLAPTSLRPIHRIWMAVGHALGWVNTRIILGLIFFGLVTPMGIIMRLAGRDPARLRFEPESDTYRVPRQPRDRTHLTHQY